MTTRLSAADRASLGADPLLELHYDGEDTLEPARKRLERADAAAWVEVRSRDVDVYQRAYTRSGLMTTSHQMREQ